MCRKNCVRENKGGSRQITDYGPVWSGTAEPGGLLHPSPVRASKSPSVPLRFQLSEVEIVTVLRTGWSSICTFLKTLHW